VRRLCRLCQRFSRSFSRGIQDRRGDYMRPRTYFYGIDAIRFVAALSVAVFHLGFWSWAGIYGSVDQTIHIFDGAASFGSSVELTWFGWVGVEVFFVISGFVIANSASGASPMTFLNGRAVRLYPVVWVCASCTFAALLLIAKDPFTALIVPYLRSLLLFPRGGWVDGVYWTLAVEIAFYLLMFVVLLLRQFAFIYRVAYILSFYSATFIALDAEIRLGMTLPFRVVIEQGVIYSVPPIFLLRHGCLFAVGIWLWIARNGQMTTCRWLGLSIALVAGGAEVYSRAIEITTTVPAAGGQSPMIPLAVWVGATLAIFAFGFAGEHLVPTSERARTTLRYAGVMTYPIYLLHNIVGAGIGRLLIAAGVEPWMAMSSALIIVVSFSFVICRSVEPALALMVRRGLGYFENTILRPRQSFAFLFVE
jgi:peptidoglycan/LPS O-acetylase OafA/YrhL